MLRLLRRIRLILSLKGWNVRTKGIRLIHCVITVGPLNRVQVTLKRGGTVPTLAEKKKSFPGLSPENRSHQSRHAEVLEVDCGGDHPSSAEDAKIAGEDSYAWL